MTGLNFKKRNKTIINSTSTIKNLEWFLNNNNVFSSHNSIGLLIFSRKSDEKVKKGAPN